MALAVYASIFGSSFAAILFHFASPSSASAYAKSSTRKQYQSIGPLPGLLHGLAKISKNMSQLTDFARLVLDHCVNAVPKSMVYAILDGAVQIEKQAASEVIAMSGGSLSLGIANEDVVVGAVEKRVEELADRLLSSFGYVPLYGAKNNTRKGQMHMIEKKGLWWIDAVIQAEIKKDEPTSSSTTVTSTVPQPQQSSASGSAFS